MELNSEALDELCRIARAAAGQAGRLIAERRGAAANRDFKSAGSSSASRIVTDTDHLSQRLITEMLAPSLHRFDLGWLAEETADDAGRFEKDHFWCVDPLDGTLPYSEGRSGFAVSIALVSRRGIPLLGAIHDPVTDVLYHAIRGAGVFKNGSPFVLPSPSSERFSLVVDRSFQDHADYASRLDAIRRLLKANNYPDPEVIQVGGAVMNALHVLEHPPACYLKFPRPDPGGGSLWDYAATAVLFHESGACATDFAGAPLDLNRDDSTFMNHRGILFASDPGMAGLFRDAHFPWSN